MQIFKFITLLHLLPIGGFATEICLGDVLIGFDEFAKVFMLYEITPIKYFDL